MVQVHLHQSATCDMLSPMNATFAAGQSFGSNVNTIYYKDDFGSYRENTSNPATVTGSNILVPTGDTDTADTYLGSETSGTLNAVATYNAVEVGVERVKFPKLW